MFDGAERGRRSGTPGRCRSTHPAALFRIERIRLTLEVDLGRFGHADQTIWPGISQGG